MPIVIQILELVSGEETPFDGQYLKEYDPTKGGVDPNGVPMQCHLVTTPNVDDAMHFKSGVEASDMWKLSNGTRWDGQPNRPLTAFSVMIGEATK